jgi:hypothetical protein
MVVGLLRSSVACAAVALVWGLACSHAGTPAISRQNEVVRYLGQADRQAETQDQRNEIKRALEDMLKVPAAELRQRRYADYQMHPARWTLVELLRRYFVPPTPTDLDESRLYDDCQAPEAKDVVRRQLGEVERAIQAEK